MSPPGGRGAPSAAACGKRGIEAGMGIGTICCRGDICAGELVPVRVHAMV